MPNHSTLVSKVVSHCGDELTILKLLDVYTKAEQINKGRQVVGPGSFIVDRKVTDEQGEKARIRHLVVDY